MPFLTFFELSETLQSVLAPEGQRLLTPAGELFKRQADRDDLPFASIIEGELLITLMSFVTPGTYWFPQTYLYYYEHGQRPLLFLRATQHKHFKKLSVITGIADADELREIVKKGQGDLAASGVPFLRPPLWNVMNMENLDSLR